MFGLFKGKAQGTAGENEGKKTISDIPLSTKEDIIAMRENGMIPSDIAKELDMESSKVSKVLELDRMRKAHKGWDRTVPTVSNPINEINLEIAKLKLERERMQAQWEIEDMKRERDLDNEEEEYIPDEKPESPMDTILKMFAMKMFAGNSGVMPSNSHDTMQPGQGVPSGLTSLNPGGNTLLDLTEDEINAILAQHPDEVKQARKMPDALIEKILHSSYPNLTEKTIKLAVECVKKQEVEVNGQILANHKHKNK